MSISHLTEREQEILSHISCGKQNKEIAKTLGLALRTVEHHVTQIFFKLNISNRTEAALYAHKNGLQPIDDGNPQ